MANTRIQEFLARANIRHRRRLGCRPGDPLEADRAAMLDLPPVPPVVGWHHSTRLARDAYVRLDSNDYSVHPEVIGRRIEVAADLHRVRAACDGRLVADHERVRAKHQTITDPTHLVRPDPSPGTARARPTGAQSEVEQRDPAVYDTALGTDGGVA